MKHVSILVPEGAILGSLEGARQLLTHVNGFLNAKGEASMLKVELVGLSKDIVLSNGLFTVHADCLLRDVKKTDMIIIPAIDGDMDYALKKNRDFVPFIKEQYKDGAEVASLCLGAFLLADTGLLEGRTIATHWMAANDFRRMYPDVNLVTEKIITDDQGIYTSGGAFSYLNLIVYLIEKHAGRDIAILIAKVFAIEIERNDQLSFTIFQGQKEHEDEPVKKAQEFIENNFQDKITIDQLANMFALGRRNLERRFKKATDNTVIEYMQWVKMEVAKKSLETERKSINEVMYHVGYSDTKAFRTTFKKITGLSPIEYRNKYNKESIAI